MTSNVTGRIHGYGTAEVRPTGNWLFKWRVWYFETGKTKSTKCSEHISRKTAQRRADAWAKSPHTIHDGSTE